MPYIITTCNVVGGHDDHDDCIAHGEGTRTAVATMDEARERCADLYADHDGDYTRMGQCADLPESGGTIGPLPDGAVIEVRQVGYVEIAAAVDNKPATWTSEQSIIAAFNERT